LFRKFFFNLWYFKNPPWDTGVSPPELLEFIRTHPPGRALDLGCGTGTNVITLAHHGWQVTGVDFARKAILAARAKTRQAGITAPLHVGDVTRLDGINGPFELILDIGCFHTLSEEGKDCYRQNLERLLAPGGTYLLYGFFKTPGGKGIGLEETDLEKLSARFRLTRREDGTNRGDRSSAWLTYQNG
jgi:SAM-dependent methyltransferase